MDRAARLSGSRFAYLKGDLVMLELALVRWVLEKLRGHGFEPVIPPVLVREQALYGTGFLPDTEQQIYALPEDELFLVGTSEVALASLHAEEILDVERAAAALRGLLSLLSPRGRRGRARTRAGSSACTSSTRSRCSASSRPRSRAAEHERILAIEEEILERARAALPRREHRRHRSRQLGREEVRLRGVAAEPGALPRADLVLEHDRLPGPAAEHPRCAATSRRRRCTRSTAPPWRSAARSSRCWRTASRPTAASRCRSASCPTARPSGLSRPVDLARCQVEHSPAIHAATRERARRAPRSRRPASRLRGCGQAPVAAGVPRRWIAQRAALLGRDEHACVGQIARTHGGHMSSVLRPTSKSAASEWMSSSPARLPIACRSASNSSLGRRSLAHAPRQDVRHRATVHGQGC